MLFQNGKYDKTNIHADHENTKEGQRWNLKPKN
jgi:hypothetical protein